MAVNPTVYFDGDKKRIYEVPNLSSFTTDGNGFRIYTPISTVGRINEFVRSEFQKDIWSKFQDWHKLNEWAVIALGRSGGAFRQEVSGVKQFATNDYQILTSKGWLIVPANYPHVWEVFGNVKADQDNTPIFDSTRITSSGVMPIIQAADSLQVVQIATSSSLTPINIASAVWSDQTGVSVATKVAAILLNTGTDIPAVIAALKNFDPANDTVEKINVGQLVDEIFDEDVTTHNIANSLGDFLQKKLLTFRKFMGVYKKP